MLKKETWVMDIIIVGLVVILGFILVQVWKKDFPGDQLALTGNMVAGIITMLGVRYTIVHSNKALQHSIQEQRRSLELTFKKQEREAFLQSAPLKLQKINQIYDILLDIKVRIDRPEDGFKLFDEYEIKNHRLNELVMHSVEVNYTVYRIVQDAVIRFRELWIDGVDNPENQKSNHLELIKTSELVRAKILIEKGKLEKQFEEFTE